eukprot:CAMPEP_0170563236 /NCGR_PEP_ID=MMETSP0211-20121228/65261_1 /TAXON_ID=311385 /ORGANISM="Pseudokeronopsis sp., Strain OXSARD2" /LENGTH=51 /DNA_ID=CAMNT_0010881211 /DNA_START=290 /DNA_END=442 /DNA_ORIENTATION=-
MEHENMQLYQQEYDDNQVDLENEALLDLIIVSKNEILYSKCLGKPLNLISL